MDCTVLYDTTELVLIVLGIVVMFCFCIIKPLPVIYTGKIL